MVEYSQVRVSIIVNNPKPVYVSQCINIDPHNAIDIHKDLIADYGDPVSVAYTVVLEGYDLGIFPKEYGIVVTYDIGYDEQE